MGSSPNRSYLRPPPSFWDNLSFLPLCPSLLREVERRQGQRRRWCLLQEAKSIAERRQQPLKDFAKHGGPPLSCLRGYPDPRAKQAAGGLKPQPFPRAMDVDMDVAVDAAVEVKYKKGSTPLSAYDDAFAQHFKDHGIGSPFPPEASQPHNFDAVRARLQRRRPSLDISPEGFMAFRKAMNAAASEQEVIVAAMPSLTGSKIFPLAIDSRFQNLTCLTYPKALVACQPDYYEGSSPANLHRNVRERLSSYIVPSNNTSRPCLPNLFLEYKGPKGDLSVARLQALYDGALGARGFHHLQKYCNPGFVPDGNAYTIVSTLCGGGESDESNLSISLVHVVPSESTERLLDYRMTRIAKFDLLTSYQEFLDGLTAFRNAREWAAEQRAELIARVSSL